MRGDLTNPLTEEQHSLALLLVRDEMQVAPAAAQLGITVTRAKGQLKFIHAKTKTTTRIGLCKWLIRRGDVKP